MKKKYYKKSMNYERLFITTVRRRYIDLAIGMMSFYFVIVISIKVFPFQVKLPNVNNKKIDKLAKPRTPVKTYTVAEGDDLWHIAEKFYGSGFNAYDISVANKINSLLPIEVGQKLVIPKVARRQPTVGEISAISTQVTYTEGKYIVQPGDSLSSISQKVYGDLFAWPKILQANNLPNADIIEVGMILTIPR